MFRNLTQRMADRFAEYVANAQDCQQTADLFPQRPHGPGIRRTGASLAVTRETIGRTFGVASMKPDLAAAKRGAAHVLTLMAVLVGSIGTLISVALRHVAGDGCEH